MDPVGCTLHAGSPCVGSCEAVESLFFSAAIRRSSYDRGDSRTGFTAHALGDILELVDMHTPRRFQKLGE